MAELKREILFFLQRIGIKKLNPEKFIIKGQIELRKRSESIPCSLYGPIYTGKKYFDVYVNWIAKCPKRYGSQFHREYFNENKYSNALSYAQKLSKKYNLLLSLPPAELSF